ncbi:hypothetical protein TCE0_042r14452 [Talaromyces pinophilus]|jgi:hypothetical protein|uniref:Uncharacterized protein n=1 Tax=Talaromyces pinophilus TaxID=128442 RepID=A0A6V8HHS6_TALPI|nr:hypothetical protein TCE0_042r14452 [Talaromyces pinophilus]
MRTPTILLLGASSVSAVPLFLRAPSTLILTISTRDSTDDENKNNDKVPIAGIVIGAIFGSALLICLVAYLVSHDNCITRRGWFKRRREKNKSKGKSSQQHLRVQEDEESLTKRASFASERESIMFSRSRASSLNFAVVEDVDHSQRRMSSQVYVLRDGKYVPVDQTEAEQRKGLLSGNEMAEVDIASSSFMDHSERASLTSIPVIVSPPPENTHLDQQHDYMSRTGTGRSNRSSAASEVSAFQEILPDDPRTHA